MSQYPVNPYGSPPPYGPPAYGPPPPYAPSGSAPPYQQSPYQQPYAPQPVSEPRNGFGITALVLGIVGTVLGMIPILGIPAIALGIVGLVFGFLALGRVRRHVATNKVMSWFGVSLSAVALVLGVVGIVIVNNAVDQLNHDLNTTSTTP